MFIRDDNTHWLKDSNSKYNLAMEIKCHPLQSICWHLIRLF
jgi:hypothetical protein